MEIQCFTTREENDDEMYKCAKCNLVLYCSFSCERKHWDEGHRDECEALGVNQTRGEC